MLLDLPALCLREGTEHNLLLKSTKSTSNRFFLREYVLSFPIATN